ncbi:precorrin-6y C5,15-methyltransferase (decarboxylating) subunit CbiE [Tabrizicola sp.]|jgi:precorrin-6B C5,15-methyltransferase / cobalt-precorrin-6B C5,C15-methyltransferase|uniref:precorrin-6y C5,15-methyltransferase (decarboxylating) subunit CbiE n=1 Tax=Tabrizicola sp. TaxID=2005166 RepID=UPI0025ED39A5|nr:precorrin-6y C5,15-methyltransferase (decarboxylating) subunit CbiE [Tabrizicola sp.]MBY0350556.1 precorrin-6y C5,15-methyltransferase (decarboxylating) subunit CbiE [Tabrizicola sp.]
MRDPKSDAWLTVIGLGEDGPEGLSPASRAALGAATAIFGGPRHLDLIRAGDRGHAWPVPFDATPVLAFRGQPTVVLASGDPFWFGAGGSLMAHLSSGEWISHPAPSTFQLSANRLGWRLEETLCLGLHAAPFVRLRPGLGRGVRAICTLRDAASVADLSVWLRDNGHPTAKLTVLERLGGPAERIREVTGAVPTDIALPVSVAIEGQDPGLPQASGLPDDLFQHDGQITKRPVRALTLSALAPRRGETLWDIGAGSGSIGIEWLLAGGARVEAVEADPERAARARANAEAFGLSHRHRLHQAQAPEGLESLPCPDAVFVGGGATARLLAQVWEVIPSGTRLVLNAVTIETEALVLDWSARHGGALLKINLSEPVAIGRKRGWKAALPILQWSVTR